MSELERIVEALLFLAPEPLSVAALAAAAEASEEDVQTALRGLGEHLEGRGVRVRELAGGFALASDPDVEPAARRLFARPRTPPLSAAQAETLAIVAYLQPVSRPEIARIRGVSSDSATGTLLERGLLEEVGRSPFGAVLLATSPLFLRLFGLRSLEELPDIATWDPSPQDEASLRERLLRAGEARSQARPAEPA